MYDIIPHKTWNKLKNNLFEFVTDHPFMSWCILQKRNYSLVCMWPAIFSPKCYIYVYIIYINSHTYKLQIYRYIWLMYVSDSSYTLAALHATLQRKNVIPMVYKYVKLCTRLKRKHTFINSTFFLCTIWNQLQRYSPIICLYMDLWDRSFSFMLSKQFGLSLIILLSITNNCFSIVQRLCSKLLLSNISYHFNIEFL